MNPRLDPQDFEPRVQQLGRELWQELQHRIGHDSPGVFNKNFWQGKALDWAMRDESFKVDLFRFVDTLPMLKTSGQVSRHVEEYLLKPGRSLPAAITAALKVASSSLGATLAAGTIRKQVMEMAERFIVGTRADEALKVWRTYHQQGIGFTADLLGEAAVSEREAAQYLARYNEALDVLVSNAPTWPQHPTVDQNHLGGIPRMNLSLKLSSMHSQLDPIDTRGSIRSLVERLHPLLHRAQQVGAFVNFDLEQWDLHDITYGAFEELASMPDFRSWPHLGIVVQAYLRASRSDLHRLRVLAQRRGAPITVRLVKGAYWDYETVIAQQRGWPAPVFATKSATDANYEALSLELLQSMDDLLPAFASHNLRSLAHALAAAETLQRPAHSIEIQMLYGMAEHEPHVLQSRGYRVRMYTPLGDLLPGMAYLVRRLLENTSNQGFLRLSHHDQVDIAQLLARPDHAQLLARPDHAQLLARPDHAQLLARPDHAQLLARPDHAQLLARPDVTGASEAEPVTTQAPYERLVTGNLDTPFENCALTDFSNPDAREQFDLALRHVQTRLPIEVPVVVTHPPTGKGRARHSGRAESTTTTTSAGAQDRDAVFHRVCPSDTRQIIARVHMASIEQAQEAAAAAEEAWPTWRDTPLHERARLLERLADVLSTRRMTLSALISFESGKPRKEADADTAEAIDFCRYYARRALTELAPSDHSVAQGETNVLTYEGRGVAVIIAPWNFPLAILCGMTTAALVAGNTVVMKPAEQSSAVGYELFRSMQEAGFPPSVIQFVPGRGEEVGAELVRDPRVSMIAFTGSKQVGLHIIEQAARTAPTQRQVKKVVCEMGGQNAIIVDDDADLDEAVLGTVRSAFGYAGQKCSACSRVLVVEAVYGTFVQRLVDATASLHMGPATDPETAVGPVIDEEAYRRLREVMQSPPDGARTLYLGEFLEGGYFLPPAIFEVDRIDHPLMQEEFFGPIVAVYKASSYEHALQVATHPNYALTGAVYTRLPSHIEQARRAFRVGNLYINRGCTGALVHRQPFGGFAMSGLGVKAGGPGYLLQFADMRCVTENTMRRGFTPQ
jgi:RHH-type proline utilization regulon transcriptional repressor/proline dehydrogenase/delta 1-pyrroline-5-carboxylate dehydrogenase